MRRKSCDGLQTAVLEHGEVGGFEIADELASLVRDNNVHQHQATGYAKTRIRRTVWLCHLSDALT